MSRYRDDWWYYTPALPIRVEGGIKAKTDRGAFSRKWWGKRWVATLESFPIGARLGRGKRYARSGQVADLRIGAGEVSAAVQGTRRTPYKVRIRLRAFTPEEWLAVMRKLRRKPLETAALLNGEMPEALEKLFASSGLSLFPQTDSDLQTDCSCPDWSNPCKHIAAVYYLLAEAFDDDPFLLLRLRGMDREQFLAQLQTAAARRAVESAPQPVGVPLPTDYHVFWGPLSLDSPVPHLVGRESNPQFSFYTTDSSYPISAQLPSILAGLASPPFWRSSVSLTEALAIAYASGTESAGEFLRFIDSEVES